MTYREKERDRKRSFFLAHKVECYGRAAIYRAAHRQQERARASAYHAKHAKECCAKSRKNKAARRNALDFWRVLAMASTIKKA
jgi:hypothetical protein